MLQGVPAWCQTVAGSLRGPYGHVWLHHRYAIGQWCCLDLASGAVVWEARHRRADTLIGIADRTLVSCEMRSDGPWTCGFGVYGIGVDSGRLVWSSHGFSLWGWFLRACDFIPGFTNELRDRPVCVRGREVVCASGRILDGNTGRTVRRIHPCDVEGVSHNEPTDAQILFGFSVPHDPVIKLGDGRFLSRWSTEQRGIYNRGGNLPDRDHLRFFCTDEQENPVWHYDVQQSGYCFQTSFYDFRYDEGYLYLIVSEEPVSLPVDLQHPSRVRPNPTRYHLLTLQVQLGEIVQDILLSGEKHNNCRIEDVSADGVLVSFDHKTIAYYKKVRE